VKLLTFAKGGVRKVGLFKDGKILELPEAYKGVHGTLEAPDFLYDMRKLIALGDPALEVARRLGEAVKGGPSTGKARSRGSRRCLTRRRFSASP